MGHQLTTEDRNYWVIDWLSRQGPTEWHGVATSWDWDDGVEPLHWIIEQPECDRATALTIFWESDPDYFLSEDGVETPIADMDEEIVSRWKSGQYVSSRFAFDAGELANVSDESIVNDHITADMAMSIHGEERAPNYKYGLPEEIDAAWNAANGVSESPVWTGEDETDDEDGEESLTPAWSTTTAPDFTPPDFAAQASAVMANDTAESDEDAEYAATEAEVVEPECTETEMATGQAQDDTSGEVDDADEFDDALYASLAPRSAATVKATTLSPSMMAVAAEEQPELVETAMAKDPEPARSTLPSSLFAGVSAGDDIDDDGPAITAYPWQSSQQEPPATDSETEEEKEEDDSQPSGYDDASYSAIDYVEEKAPVPDYGLGLTQADEGVVPDEVAETGNEDTGYDMQSVFETNADLVDELIAQRDAEVTATLESYEPVADPSAELADETPYEEPSAEAKEAARTAAIEADARVSSRIRALRQTEQQEVQTAAGTDSLINKMRSMFNR